MASNNKTVASKMLNAIEDLKASKKQIQSQHAILGLQLSNLDARISTLENLLTHCGGACRDTDNHSSPSSALIASDSGAPLLDASSAAAANININVVDQIGNSSERFVMKRSSPLKVLMDTCCASRGEKSSNMVLLLNGRYVGTDQTPEQLDMEDGDRIRVTRRWD